MPELSWPRCIAHLDLDAFYATVEEILDPAIKGLPILVVMGENTSGRGVVATASYAARAFGVHSAMPVSQARRLCPGGVYLPVRHSLYREYSSSVMNVLLQETSLLEQVSIDEAYLDLSGVPEPVSLAKRLQARIQTEIGLTASVGLATNKLVSKMASGYRKPGGLTVVEPEQEASFLGSLPAAKLFGVGPKTAARLKSLGISTIGEIASMDLDILQANFGPNLGLELKEHAAGQDSRPIVTQREAKSLSYERTYFEDEADPRLFWRNIREMSLGLEGRLQKQGLLARTVSIKLRFANWKTITRSETLRSPTGSATSIAASAARLMRQTWQRGTPLRLLGVRVSNFIELGTPYQLELLPLLNQPD